MGYLMEEDDTYREVSDVKENLRKAKKALCKAIEAYEEVIESEMYGERLNTKSRSRYKDRYDY